MPILLLLLVAPFLLFSSKIETSRVVTIKRPLVISHQRKTPAFYVYEQTKNLISNSQENQKVTTLSVSKKNLTTQDLAPTTADIKTTEMVFTKKEAIVRAQALGQVMLAKTPVRSKNWLANTTRTIANSLLNFTPTDSVLGVVGPQMQEATVLHSENLWATVKGKFELKDGVAIVDHAVELKRVQNGITKELGEIDIFEGAYSIDLDSPGGYLVAQIKDKNGKVIGEDKKELSNLLSRGPYLEGPYLKLGQPSGYGSTTQTLTSTTTTSAATTVASNKAAETASAQAVNENTVAASVFSSKASNANQLSSASTRIFRYSDINELNKNSVSIKFVGDQKQIPTFSKAWVDGIISYISDQQKIQFHSENTSILIGKVVSAGKALAGATVQIETNPGLMPVYLDSLMIPNLNLKSTSESGYFIFVGVEKGVYNVLANFYTENIAAQMFIAEENAVAYQELNSAGYVKSKVLKTFDAFEATPVSCSVATLEQDELIETNGDSVYRTKHDQNISEYVVRSENRKYTAIRYIQTSSASTVYLPMIQEDWIEKIKAQRQINIWPNTGVFVGFTGELDYNVYVANTNYDYNNVVYFDNFGQMTSGPSVGGGFILFNLPAGANEVILEEKTQGQILSQVVPIYQQQISIAHFGLN